MVKGAFSTSIEITPLLSPDLKYLTHNERIFSKTPIFLGGFFCKIVNNQ